MVDPVKGKPLVERVNVILKQHSFKHIIKHYPKANTSIGEEQKPESTQDTLASAAGVVKKIWGKLWKK